MGKEAFNTDPDGDCGLAACDYCTGVKLDDETRIETLRDALETYDVAAEKFISKVESGRARSMETYNDLKQALAKSKEVFDCF